MHVPGLTEHGTIAFASSAMEAMPVITDDCIDHASQAKTFEGDGANGL